MQTIDNIKKGLACFAQDRSYMLPCSDCAYHGQGLPPCRKAVHEDALALIEQMEAQVPKWISVEERLPDVDPQRDYKDIKFSADVVVWENGRIRTAYYCHTTKSWQDSVYEDEPVDPTFWMMPLPTPPKEDAHAQTD